MASLKDINATIVEGNEDLEKLNENFAKWFESQKKSGDDLEAAKEARMKRGKGGVVKAAATGAVVGKMTGGGFGLPGNLLTKAAIAAVVAAAIAAALKYLKNNDMDPKTTLADGTFADVYDNPNSSPFTGSTVKTALNKINSQKARLKMANARLAAQLRTANNKIKTQATLIDDLEKPTKKPSVIRNESRQDIKNRVGNDGPDKIPKTNTRINNSRLRGSEVKMTAAGAKIFNNAKVTPGVKGFQPLTTAESAALKNNPTNASNKAAMMRGTAMTKAFSNMTTEFKKHLAAAKAMPRPGMGWKTGQAYGQAIMDYLQGKTPTPVQKFLKLFFHPRILGIGFTLVSLFEIALIWQNKKLHLTKVLPGGEPAIVDHKYTLPEQIAATAAVVAGFPAAMLGAAIGGAIGFMSFGPPGSFAGTLIGGYLGYQQMGVIVQFVYDIANRINVAFYGEELNAFKARMTAKNTTEVNTISGNAKLADFERDSVGYAATGMFGTGPGVESRRINAVKAFAAQNSIATNFQSAAYSDKRNMSDSQRGTVRKAQQKSIFDKATGLINSGLSLLGFGTAGASEMSTPVISSPIVGMSADQLMNSPEAGRGTTANAVVNSGNTTSNVTTVLSGSGGIKTIDTNPIQWMGYGPPNLQHYY